MMGIKLGLMCNEIRIDRLLVGSEFTNGSDFINGSSNWLGQVLLNGSDII